MVKDTAAKAATSGRGSPSPSDASEAATDAGLASLAADQKIAELETQLQEANEKALRAGAELENYRKRVQREVSDERRYAALPLARDLLAVLDNLQRAIEATPTRSVSERASEPSADSSAGLLEGVKLVAAQFEAVLQQHGCTPIETVGAPFDPNQHQAIAQEPSDQYPAGTVTRCAQIGYKLHDRVVRPAQVFVSTGPA
jgi:molecular chaperone GrpE